MPSRFTENVRILSDEQLSNLRYYKYQAVDKSPVSKYVLRHYWDWAIKLFPLWIAPNLITLLGLGFMVINVILVAIFTPDLGIDGPRWIYFSFAAGLWLYSTFDNVDGRQARRTGNSSPLGELFDHGCDSVNCAFVAILQAAGMGMGHSVQSAILAIITALGFYLSTIEEYHTGVLYLGYINGPTEGLILSCIVFIISGLKGPDIWQLPLGSLFNSMPSSIQDTTMADLFVYGFAFFFIFTHLPVCIHTIYQSCRQKGQEFWPVILHEFFPIVVFTGLCYAWVQSPNSSILSGQHLILFITTTGIIFGRIASKVIIAHLTKSDFPTFSALLTPIFIGVFLVDFPRLLHINPILSPRGELAYLWGFFAFVVIAYLRWAIIIINQFCDYLDIQCLKIPYKSNRNGKGRERSPLLREQEEGHVYGSSSSA
ncbi:CDP-alcohol phosphatidyltransferase-domain-containing protein [Umbelopsis sp. PMI_123]|nr:CDP-alcohol phosphatidyltransferase-domain-containing protein [Umbelopsis sp. PMI_123]